MHSHWSASSESGVHVRAMRHRVLPGTRAKARRLNRLAGACRSVWNELLDQQEILHYTARMFGGRSLSQDRTVDIQKQAQRQAGRSGGGQQTAMT